MGKSEILMLLAGVALSIMLAMIAIPMFSSGSEMADRQQIQQDLMAIKSSIPLILALEGNGEDKFIATNIKKHVTGFDTMGTGTDQVLISSNTNSKKATYKISDNEALGISVYIDSSTSGKADLSKLTKMINICDGDDTPAYIANVNALANGTNVNTFLCKMKR